MRSFFVDLKLLSILKFLTILGMFSVLYTQLYSTLPIFLGFSLLVDAKKEYDKNLITADYDQMSRFQLYLPYIYSIVGCVLIIAYSYITIIR